MSEYEITDSHEGDTFLRVTVTTPKAHGPAVVWMQTDTDDRTAWVGMIPPGFDQDELIGWLDAKGFNLQVKS